jgi:hypothetical protein
MTNYETRFAKLQKDINLLKWMLGLTAVMPTAILFRVFS